ncbi:MAG: hypothetical protein V2J51_08660 [Erythrobacter sp.]|jgi:hypothetical protein|nr:hypothetical protein [Erythrobacter sp.]
MLEIAVKGVVIAFFAAVAAWLPAAAFWTLDMDQQSRFAVATRMLPIAILGSYVVGLPVAMLTFFFARRHLIDSPKTLFLMANLSAIVMTLASYAIGDRLVVLMLGVPSFIAANTYAFFGWIWVINLIRENGS